MTLSQNRCFSLLVLIVSCVLLSSCSIVFAADAMPAFSEEDFAGCTITGMKLDYAVDYETETETGISGEFWDEKGEPQTPNTSFVDFSLYYYLNAEEARGYYKQSADQLRESCKILANNGVDTLLQCDVFDDEATVLTSQILPRGTYYFGSYYRIYDEHYFYFFQFELHPPGTEQQAWDMLAQTKTCIMSVINSKDRKFFGNVTNAWDKKLPRMVVKLTYDGKEYETTTDLNGDYKIPFQGQLGKKAKISFVLQYQMEGATYFKIVVHDLNQPYEFIREFTLRDAKDLKQDFVVQGDQGGTEFFGYLFYRLHEAVNFYTTVLKIKPEPVRLAPFIPSISYSKYLPPEKLIGFSLTDTVFMQYNDTLPVRSTEYHEYSHHVMNSVYGEIPRNQNTAPVEEINHKGYTNPSTTDSFVEGFAVFMSQVIKDKLRLPNGGVDDKVGKIEQNFPAWGSEGFDELYSVAGIFWDLYDGIEPKDSDAVQLTIEQIWDVLSEKRQNMNEVYQALVKAYPEQKAEIDQIFVSHGFFADTDKGNESYDPGEPVRKGDDGTVSYFVDLANPVVWDNQKVDGKDSGEKETIGKATNYQRPERNFPPTVPGYFIKTAGSFPFYKLSCTFPDYPALDYELIVEQLDGLIPIAVPPEQYQATITIEGYGSDVTTNSPLGFTNQEFLSSYPETTKNGYFREHDFRITGPALERPEVDPSLINMEKSSCLASSVLGANDPRLYILRRFRDEVLVKSPIGNQLVNIYYENSGTLVEVLEGHEFCRTVAATFLKKIIPVIELTLT
jgi:hypothetical protein